MNDFQFIKINADSSIKMEYKRTEHVDIPNPDNLKGKDLFDYVSVKIAELQSQDVFFDLEEDILEKLELIDTTSPSGIVATPGIEDLKTW